MLLVRVFSKCSSWILVLRALTIAFSTYPFRVSPSYACTIFITHNFAYIPFLGWSSYVYDENQIFFYEAICNFCNNCSYLLYYYKFVLGALIEEN